MIVHGHQVCQTYLAFKQHFSNPKFDFFKYDGKVKVKEETYQQRPDFWFFETLARKLKDQEVLEYMLGQLLYRARTQRRYGLEISKEMAMITGWYSKNSTRVSPILFNRIVNDWLVSWRKSNTPLMIYLKRWVDILHPSDYICKQQICLESL